MELRALILSLLVLTLISSSESRSLDSPVQCATTCIEPSGVFQEDYSYVYKYDANVVSKFHADTNDVSAMRMQATVKIHAVSACELVLTITDAELNGGHADWAASISRNPVHFNWQNGRIPNICAHNDDPIWVLNIKRGILSNLQVSTVETAKTVKETDVHGMCETSYANDDGVITKVKNFDSCEGREEFMLFTYFTPYNSDSPRQSFIASEQECTVVIDDDNLVQSSLCEESHVFRPFSNDESGAKTAMRQSLQYRNKYPNYIETSLTIGNSNSKSLVFENEEVSTSLSTDVSEIRDLFRQTCNTLDTENYEEVAKYFIKLVFLLRRIDDSAIEQVYNMLDGVCPAHEASLKKMFENALPWCGSESCVLFSAGLISGAPNSIPNMVAKQWLTGISLIPKPTMNTLSAVKRIVLSGKFEEQAFLTAGTILYRICQSASKNCVMHPEIRNFLNFFEEKLGRNCRTTSEEQKQAILLSLRAIGNAGQTNDVNLLRSCASEENNDMETRIAAIQAFRRMPCNVDRSGLENILFDLEEDSEARIASYVSLMKCPKPKLIEQLVILLNQNDEILQVNSFIWSHLQQTLESKDPLKHFLKPILMETAFTKPHNLDPRKYSKYYEASVFSDALNAGATVESSVVWSPKSFVPRSADLGLSVNLFGQAVNLFEIGGRVEGVEKMVQNMMESDGFKNNPLGQFFKPDADVEVDDDEEEEEEIIRPRISRSVDKTILERKQDQYSRNVNTENQPNGNMYMRVFGNEMFYGNARSFKAKKEEIDLPSIFTKLARDGKYQYHDDTMLINSAHVLPTGLGLPLQIAFNGSASVDLDLYGHMDLKGMFNSPPSLKVGGKIEPRAVVYLTGSMIVDGRAARSGISTKTSSTTSWTVQGSATVSQGRKFAVELGAPYQRNTFFSFEHKLLKWNGEQMVQLSSSAPARQESCSKVKAGQRFCVHKPDTMEVFPVSGVTKVDAYLEKRDRFKKYTMNGSLEYELEIGKMMPRTFRIEANMDAPDSIADFRTTLLASYSLDDMEFSANLRTPEVNRRITGSVESEPNQWNLLLDYSKNDQSTRLTIGTRQVQEGDGKTWVATSTFTNQNEATTGTAAFKLEPYRSIKANLTIDNLFRAPIVWNVSLNDNSERGSHHFAYEGGARLTIPDWIDTGARFNIKFHPRFDNFNFKLTYLFDDGEEQTVMFQHKRRDESTLRVTKWSADQKFVMSQYKAFNHQVKIMYANDETSVSSFVKFDYGRHASHQRNTKYILLNESLSFTKTNARTELSGYAQIDIQPYNVVYNGQLSHVHTNEQLQATVNVNQYNLSLLVVDNSGEVGHFSRRATVKVPTPWGRVRMSSDVEKRPNHVYFLNGTFALGSAQGLQLSGSCEVVNQATRKSITVNIGQDENSILSARSSFAVRSQMGFDFQNQFQSMFTNLVELNASYTGNSQSGSNLTFAFSHNPTTYYSLLVMSKITRNKSTRSIRAEFKDSSAFLRHLELKGVKWLEEEAINMTGSLLTNMRLFSFGQASVSIQRSTDDIANYAGFLVTKDHEEMMGVNGSLPNNALQAEANDPVSATVNLRQQLSDLVPKFLAIGTEVNWQDDGCSFNVEVHLDKPLLSLRATINSERNLVRASLTHDFRNTPIPRSVHVLIEKSPTRNRITLHYDKPTRKEIQLTLTKESKNRATFMFSNNDEELKKLPSNVEGSIEYGTRPSDRKKGVWIRAVIDGRVLNAKLMSKVSEASMDFNFQFLHEFEAIPTINTTLSFAKTTELMTILAVVNVNNSPHLIANLVCSNEKQALKFMQNNNFLPRFIPGVIAINLSQEWDDLPDIKKVLKLQVDDQSLTMTFSNTPEMVALNLDSNFTHINGRHSIVYRRAPSLCELQVSRNNQKFLAIVDTTKGMNATASQNIFESILPQKLNAFVTKSDNSVNLGAQYNKNHFSMIMSSDGTTSSVHFSSKGSLFKKFKAPKIIDLTLELPNSNEGTVNVLVKSKKYMLSCVSSLRLNEKQFSFGMVHDIDSLAELGVEKNIDVNASLASAFERGKNMVKARVGVLYNDVDYSVYFNVSTKMQEDEPKEINVTLGHSIMSLHNYGVPLEVSLNNELNSELLDGSLSLATKVFRVYLNDSNKPITLQNSINFTVDFDVLRGPQLTLTLAHNLSIPDFPRLLKLKSSVDLGSRSSTYDRKSLRIAFTRDEIQETAMFFYDWHQVNEDSPSLTFEISQNVTLLCSNDVPKKVKLTITKTSLDLVYDLVQKNATFECDFHEAERLKVLFNHNFDILKQLKIPNTIGGTVRFSYKSDEIELKVEPIYNENKYVAHFTTRFNAGQYRYTHHQNMVSDDYFPTRLRAQIDTHDKEHTVVIIINSLRATANIFSPSSMDFYIKNLNLSFIRAKRIQGSIEKDDNNRVVISLIKDKKTMRVTVTPEYNSKLWTASVNAVMSKSFVESFPEVSLYANTSIGLIGSAYFNLQGISRIPYEIGLKYGLELSEKKVTVEFTHNQHKWRSIIPKDLEIISRYMNENNMHSINIDVKRDRKTDSMRFSADYSIDSPWFAIAQFNHTFDEFEYVPQKNKIGLLIELLTQSIMIHANATVGDKTYVHMFDAMYNKPATSLSLSVETVLKNGFLNDMDVPQHLSGSFSAEWENMLSTVLTTKYGRNIASFSFNTDREQEITLAVQQTWIARFRNVTVNVSKEENNRAVMEINLDGIRHEINVEGNWNENQANITVNHSFEDADIPNSIELQSSYRFSPDYFVSLNAIVDQKEHYFEGHYKELENGFHFSSNILGVASSVTLKNAILPGGFSLELDHSIPSLMEYIPKSSAINGNIRTEPKLNVTGSIRLEDNTKKISFEVDSKLLRFAFKHNFAILPIPSSIEFELGHSKSPASIDIKVTVNGIVRSASAAVDREGLQARVSHTIPELDQWFAARQVVVGLKKHTEALGGELYVSIDGVERRVGGSFLENTISIFSTFEYVPRNITLKVEGVLQPLNGQVILFLDGIERSVGAEVNVGTKEFSATFSLNAPETEAIIPGRLTISSSYNKTGAQLDLSFPMNNKNQSLKASINVKKGIAFVFSHDVDYFSDIVPEMIVFNGEFAGNPILIDLFIGHEEYSFEGKFLNGQDDRWYGVEAQLRHTSSLLAWYNVLDTASLVVKGKKTKKSVEAAVSAHLVEGYTYQATAEVTGEMKKKRKSLVIEYNHTLNNLEKAVSVALLTTNKNQELEFTLDASQTKPERKEFNVQTAVDLSTGGMIQYSLTFKQNVFAMIPQDVTIPQATFELLSNSSSARWEISVSIDGETSSSSGSVSVYFDRSASFIVNAQAAVQHRECHKTFHFSTKGNRNLDHNEVSVNYMLNINDINTDIENWDDNITIVISVQPNHPFISALVKQDYLNNDLGIPRLSEISADITNNGPINKHCEFHFKIGDISYTSIVDFHVKKDPFYLKIGSSLNGTKSEIAPRWVNLLPTHALAYLTVDCPSQLPLNVNSSLNLEYENRELHYNSLIQRNKTSGSSDEVLTVKNIPGLKKWLGASLLKRSYDYHLTNNNILQARGKIQKDSVTVVTYTFDMNLATKAFSYTSQYDENDFVVLYDMQDTQTLKNVTFLISENGTVMVNFNFAYSTSKLDFLLKNNVREPRFHVQITALQNNNNISANATVNSDQLHYSCDFSVTPLIKDGQKGQIVRLIKVLDGAKFDSSLLYSFSANSVSGNIKAATSYKDSSVVLSYTPKTLDFTADYDNNHMEIHYNNKSTEESMSYKLTLGFGPKKLRRKFGLPASLSASIEQGSSRVKALVTADKTKLVDLDALPWNYSLTVRSLFGNQRLSTNGWFQYGSHKVVEMVFASNLFEKKIALQFNGELQFLKKKTGNSSLNVTLVDAINDKNFALYLTVIPTKNFDAEDFVASLSANSTFEAVPFKIHFLFDSSKEPSMYNGTIVAAFNDKKISIDFRTAPANATLQIIQTWCSYSPMTINWNTDSSNNFKTTQVKMQWSEDPLESFTITIKMKIRGIFSYSIQAAQPSGVFLVSSAAANVSFDITSPDTYLFNAHSNLNDYKISLNVNYTGNLPQVFGTHSLDVDITQPIFLTIPTQFKTTGRLFISPTQYISSWSIKSNKMELAVLNKSFSWTDNMSMNFHWKQSYVNTQFRFVKMEAAGSDGGMSGSATLQVDDMPRMSGSYRLMASSDSTNRSLSIELTSGPLSRYVLFRTLSFAVWNSEENPATTKQWSVSWDIDRRPNKFYLKQFYASALNKKNNLATTVIKIDHSFELQLFGQPLPNSITMQAKSLVTENKSRRYVASYGDNLRQKNFTFSFEYKNPINPFDLTISADKEQLFKAEIFVKEESLSLSVNYPEKHLNAEIVMQAKNNDHIISFNITAKNYTTAPMFECYEFSFSFDKNRHIIVLAWNYPQIDRTELRGDLSQVISQAKRMFRRMLSEASSSSLSVIKGITPTETGYDMYLGFEKEGDAAYTLHLLVGTNNGGYFAAVQTKKNFEVQSDIFTVSAKIIDHRLAKLKLSANPTLIKFIQVFIHEFNSEAAYKINRFADLLIEGMKSLKTVTAGNEEIETGVNARVDALIGRVNKLRNHLILLVANFASGSEHSFGRATSATEEGVRKSITMLLDMVDNLKAIILRPFTDVYDQYMGTIIRKINNNLIDTLQPITAVFEKFHAGQLFIELVIEAVEKIKNYVMTNGESCFTTLRTPLSDFLYVDGNNVIFAIPLAVEVEQLKPLPTIEDLKAWLARSALAITINENLEKLYSYVDEYYKVRALLYIPRDELLPPFKGHAFVSGFRHFSTFDKRYFDFSSGCATSHLWLSDMRGENFTVAISYAEDSNSEDSIEVIVGNDRVTLYNDYEVRVNRRVKQLPVYLDTMSVMLKGNVIHVRKNEGDLEVACDFSKHLCSVEVSPFYFGATAGLAGIYNNEPFDDFTKPDHEIASSVTEFTDSWTISAPQCSTNTYRPCASNNRPTRCAALFKNTDSPLRPCFPLVDPQPFMKMCEDDLCNAQNTKKVCQAAHAYAHECNLKGARVRLPDECVECVTLRQDRFNANTTKRLPIRSADIVLVLERGSCMRNIGKSMKQFIRKLIPNIRGAGISDIHYHLVGYGGVGPNVDPSSYTFSGRGHTDQKNAFHKAIRDMDISFEESQADTLGAILYASQLPFRAGAKPIIISVSCDSCINSEVSYSQVERQIRKQGIILHHVPMRQITAGRKSMFGFDSINAFSGGRPVVKAVVQPNKQDMCEPLATVTGGSVWNGVLMMKPNKSFHMKFTEYIVSKIRETGRLGCTCEMNEMGVPTSVCH